MRVAVIGGYGLIGSYVIARLLAEGREVVGVGRDIGAAQRRFPGVRWNRADLRTSTFDDWAGILENVDAVVNCAGALQSSPRDDLAAVHVQAVESLARVGATAGVRRFIHISAAGLEHGAQGEFARTKLAAEAALKATDLDWIILRPGLVIAPAAYGGSALLRGLAGFPGFVPLAASKSRIELVSVEDVALAVGRCLEPGAPSRVVIDLVSGDGLSLAEIVLALRGWLGIAPAPIVPVPRVAAVALASACDLLGLLGWRSPMRSTSLAQLRAGVAGDAVAAGAFGLRLRSLSQMLAGGPAGVQERWFARMYFLKPAILVGLGLFWLASGLIGLARLPVAAELLSARPFGVTAAWVLAMVGSLLDIVLALAIAFRPTAGLALVGMIAASLAYMIGGAALRPDLWLDPQGPMIKIAPVVLLCAAALAMLDER